MRATTGNAAVVLLMAGLMAGCLTESRRVGGDADTSGDTATDTASDTTGDTGFDSDATDLCRNVDCDDRDPCTYDQCDPTSGECSHLGVPGTGGAPLPGCASTPDCEDGDPCTINTCVDLGCGAGGFCTSEVRPGCNDCATGCDDGDPCTTDVCRDTQCLHAFQDGCMAGCVAGDTYTIADIRTPGASLPEPLKTTGELFFHELGRACNDGPTCDCIGSPGLRDAGFDLVLRVADISIPGNDVWQCRSSGCQELSVACEPAHVRVNYRVWGRGLPEWELFGGSAALPAPSIAGVAVQDYCLETNGDSLVGNYKGRIDLAGYVLTFKAEVIERNGALRLRSEAASCDGCPGNLILDQLDVPLVIGDGWVELDASLPTIAGATQGTVRLYSNRNTLQGRYGQLDGVVPFIALPPGGAMSLTRLP